MLGIMIISAILSLWISNFAACSLVIPIVYEIILNYFRFHHHSRQNSNRFLDLSSQASLNISIDEEEDKNRKDLLKAKNLGIGLYLACTYASSFGSIASLIKTPQNILLKSFYSKYYPELGLNLVNYAAFAMPLSIMLIILTWLWLSRSWINKDYKNENSDDLDAFIRERYASLGPQCWEENSVLFLTFFLIFSWMIIDTNFIKSYSSLNL
jgi:sodium-dependent dicarboxylate transporter 2/3/5